MSGTLLTAEERNRFRVWLTREAESNEAMARQLVNMNMGVPGEIMRKKYATEALAFRVVAKVLERIQEEKIE